MELEVIYTIIYAFSVLLEGSETNGFYDVYLYIGHWPSKKQAMSEESLLSLLKDSNFLLCQFQQTHKDFQISFNLKSFPKNWVIFQTSFSLFSWSLSVAVWNRRNIMNPRPIFPLKPWAKRNLAVLIQQS